MKNYHVGGKKKWLHSNKNQQIPTKALLGNYIFQATKHAIEKKLIEGELEHQKEVEALQEQCAKLKADAEKQKEVRENLRKPQQQKIPENLEKQLVESRSFTESICRLLKKHRGEVRF